MDNNTRYVFEVLLIVAVIICALLVCQPKCHAQSAVDSSDFRISSIPAITEIAIAEYELEAK